MEIKEFHWLHIPSGETGKREFTALQGQNSLPEYIALHLVNKWNSQTESWKYWIEL